MDEFGKYYGPIMNAFEAAEKNGRAANLQKELEELFKRQNKSTSIPATFLAVTQQLELGNWEVRRWTITESLSSAK